MSTSESIAKLIADNIKALNPNITEFNHIARKNAEGVITASKGYVGVDNDRRGIGYIRFRDDQDEFYDLNENQYTSEGLTYAVRVPLRLVVMHKYGNRQEDYKHFLAGNVMRTNFKSTVKDFNNITLISSCSDIEKIISEETDKPIEELQLSDETFIIQMDFDVIYITDFCSTFNHNEC